MSASEDMSESNSPFSQSDSPYSSPSHQVPQLANFISELSCAESANVPRGNGPYLCIVEQPQDHFRFRYKSEMIGTHGCLLGKSYASSKSKTHPTVELRNYTGKALIRCRLARHNSTDEHPHKLLEDDQDRDVHSWLPEKGSYRVAFRGMGIIHTAKKDVASLLYKKYSLERPESTFDENKLRLRCENEAKNINLNIVRLKFSAHDPHTEAEICPPVFSEWIHNMKSAATNDLKICRISRCVGRPRGGEDVFIFVEKVNKKNIMIKFFELDKHGERIWSKNGKFIQSDVHHQYAIAFRTPSYHDLEIARNVKVFIELVRPSDGRTSEPKEFTYRPESIVQFNNKRKKPNSTCSSLDSSSGSSITSFSDLPAPVVSANQNKQYNNMNNINMDIAKNFTVYDLKVPQNHNVSNDVSMMADALLYSYVGSNPVDSKMISPLLSQPNVPEPPVLQLHSSELDRVLERSIDVSEEKKQFLSTDFSEYFENLDSSINEPGAMDWIKASMMVSDSGRGNEKVEVKEEIKSTLKKKIPTEYTAFYKSEDGNEVKKLVKELCEMIRNKSGYKKQVVKTKLERLFELRLSNGDTFLHMTLSSNQPSLEYIVKLIHNMKMTKLLNMKNNAMQTILHLAIINDSPKLVSFLISKGCNPMEEDDEGNNALHYAVICQTCLDPLLKAIKTNGVSFDINAFNNEKQTALHLSSVYGCPRSVRSLLAAGADARARDADGRTALHLAVYDDCEPCVRALLQPQCDVDAVDGKGYTALQIACDSEVRENTREIVKLLLAEKADPTKHEDNNHPAWKLARGKPQIEELFQKYITPRMIFEEDIKSEPEDEFDSAEEGEAESDLTGLQIYIDRVAALLDNNGGWIQLMKKLKKDSYQSWFSATRSPTRTLLYNVKETDELSSKSLYLILEDIGQFEAANIIKACIGES